MAFSRFRTEVMEDIRRGTWVFRGQENPAWGLECSYDRICRKTRQSFSCRSFLDTLNRFIDQVSDYYVKDYHSITTLPQKMAFAQHYGLPTLLLDWTYSPYVAMYFALSGLLYAKNHQRTIQVWAINVEDLDGRYMEPLDEEGLIGSDDGFWFISTSNFCSRRISRQQGCFTCSNSSVDLTNAEVRDRYGIEMIPYKVSCDVIEVLQELRLMGITGSSMFDDIDYIARDIILDSLFRLRTER